MTYTTTHYLLTYLKALGLIGVLFFGAPLTIFAHFECLGNSTGFLPFYGPLTFPVMWLFILSKVPSLYWLGRWIICVPWIFIGWIINLDPSSRLFFSEWVRFSVPILTLAVLWLTLAHQLARDSSRPGASSLFARVFVQAPPQTDGTDSGESIGLRRRRIEDLSFLLLSIFIIEIWGEDRSLRYLVFGQLMLLFPVLYPLTVTVPLFLRGLPLTTMGSARTTPSARQLIVYGLMLTLAVGLICIAVMTGRCYPSWTERAVPLTLFIFFVPFIFSSVFALSMNLFGCAQLRFTSAHYPPHHYLRMTFACVAKSFAFALLHLYLEWWYWPSQ